MNKKSIDAVRASNRLSGVEISENMGKHLQDLEDGVVELSGVIAERKAHYTKPNNSSVDDAFDLVYGRYVSTFEKLSEE